MYLNHSAVVGLLTTHIVGIYNEHAICAHCNVFALSHFVTCIVQHKNVETKTSCLVQQVGTYSNHVNNILQKQIKIKRV